jgi:hypothetical protein
MRHMFVGLTAVVVSVGVMSAASQGRNFSGTWTIDLEKTMAERQASGAAGAGGGGVISGGMVAAGGGGGGVAVARSGGSGGTGGGFGGGVIAASGGGGGGTMVARAGGSGGGGDTVITLSATALTMDVGDVRTVYPLNGAEVALTAGANPARATAVWDGDTVVITTTVDRPTGQTTSTARWSVDGDWLVRDSGVKVFYKRKS